MKFKKSGMGVGRITLIVVFDPPPLVRQQFPYPIFQSVGLPGERDTLELQFPAL